MTLELAIIFVLAVCLASTLLVIVECLIAATEPRQE
jgi:hypothetical protein